MTGCRFVRFWLSVVEAENAKTADRLEASKLLAERGWGKAPAFAPVEETDPLGLEQIEQAAEGFRAEVMRLAKTQRTTNP